VLTVNVALMTVVYVQVFFFLVEVYVQVEGTVVNVIIIIIIIWLKLACQLRHVCRILKS
jgi:hypothetical protein